ncbi:Hypothetical predicted protein [Marmota monax]|uniref:SLC26A/SulP transporter domain-containing protein n=1 Tax=Marmota monax TaxID=9995 RepID=A0A5E4ATB0_MARMO|nr:hypothetical protein GHT09_013629 [Marmota monax]VTJ60588.1 Hypothetical predicted protein [Marmota monax]
MTGSAVERLVPEPLSRNLSGIEKEQLDAQRVGAAAAVAFGSGALMVREDPKKPLREWSHAGARGIGQRKREGEIFRSGSAGLGCSGEAGALHPGGSVPTSVGECTSSPQQLGMFVLQLGVLSTFLSEPVVKALTSGAALHVLVSQLPSLLGLSLPRQIGCFSLFKVGVGKQRRRGF